jgi:hypothetical protein
MEVVALDARLVAADDFFPELFLVLVTMAGSETGIAIGGGAMEAVETSGDIAVIDGERLEVLN